MTEYLISFNAEWVGEHTEEELRAKTLALRPLVAEMKERGILIFTGGLEDAPPLCMVDASSGTPVFTDGPYPETKEHLAGFFAINVESRERADQIAAQFAGPGETIELRPAMVFGPDEG